MDSPDVRAQLLVSNLQFLLRYLTAADPEPAAGTLNPQPQTQGASGGALSLTAPAQKHCGGQ